MGLSRLISPARAAKKWENLKKTYKLLSTLLIRLVLLMLVLLIIRPWLLFHWLPEITIADADVVQDGATGSHLDCKDRARAWELELP
uniref:Uncharacterized protein n=1 Tax=Knipowitschia caucasica TaxID=637954 RepID=A0AAV2KF07_KNICA